MIRKWPVLALTLALAGCGAQAAPASTAPSVTVEAGPPPAPTSTQAPTGTPVPTDTAVPTDTPPPTFTPQPPTATPIPDTPTPIPPTSTPTHVPSPTVAAATYPPNPYERLTALRYYHLQFSVNADTYSYSVVGDEATPNYHIAMQVPFSPPIELWYVNGRYVSSLAGVITDDGASPPMQAGVLEAAEQFARDWFDHPDGSRFVGTETVNGVRANHFVLTWKAGRQVSLGAISATTYDPTTGDAWLDATNGALIKASFNMRVNGVGGVSPVSVKVDVTNINRPVTITLPHG